MQNWSLTVERMPEKLCLSSWCPQKPELKIQYIYHGQRTHLGSERNWVFAQCEAHISTTIDLTKMCDWILCKLQKTKSRMENFLFTTDLYWIEKCQIYSWYHSFPVWNLESPAACQTQILRVNHKIIMGGNP